RLLYISLDNGQTWDTELSLNLSDKFKFNNEVTSNGINFYKAATKRDDGLPITFTNAESGIDYLEFDILFKANAPLGVFLDSTSTIIPTAGHEENELIGQGITRKSSYGDFSRDLIAGAVRVAFIENDYVENKYIPKLKSSLVWAPNKEYELMYNKGYYTFNINSNNNQDYKYINAASGVSYELVDNLKDNLNTDFINDNANGDPMITKIDEKFNDGIKAVTVRIWIEGNDREAHTALTGGMFTLNLNFMGIIKEENPLLPDVSEETINNKILNYKDTMEYSKDNGNTWIKYSEDTEPIFESGDVVFVRYVENTNYYASKYKILNY
ncbi:MAG: hypothetical protein IJO27_03945, partial [Bacilli bacterium]|nr:hypothetical protein [Bacilli bacterium]